jgi:hypothetical protein
MFLRTNPILTPLNFGPILAMWITLLQNMQFFLGHQQGLCYRLVSALLRGCYRLLIEGDILSRFYVLACFYISTFLRTNPIWIVRNFILSMGRIVPT